MSVMTLNQTTTTTKPQIHIKRVYKHDINKLWTALTTKAALSNWLMQTTDFELREGQIFQFRAKPQGGWDGIVHCKVLSFSQPNSITYSWQANGMKKPTIVTWELKELAKNETLLTLSHAGFEGFGGWFTRQILNFGWKSMLRKKLTKHLLQ